MAYIFTGLANEFHVSWTIKTLWMSLVPLILENDDHNCEYQKTLILRWSCFPEIFIFNTFPSYYSDTWCQANIKNDIYELFRHHSKLKDVFWKIRKIYVHNELKGEYFGMYFKLSWYSCIWDVYGHNRTKIGFTWQWPKK